jgi:hypothetical protein
MKITLKNLKYIAAMSHETHAFSATLYVDGVKLCTVGNSGCGGTNEYQPLKGQKYNVLMARIRDIDAELGKTIIKSENIADFSYPNDLECEVGERVNEWHRLQEVKRILRRISYLKPDGKLYQLPARYKPSTRGVLAAVRAQAWFADDYTMLSGLTPEAAMVALEKVGFFK